MKAQARAQSELRSLIKQYDEMLHKNWDMATEEQKARIEVLKQKSKENVQETDVANAWVSAVLRNRGEQHDES